jgi:Holliday junction resolvase RusA-like endonuclease
MPTWTPQDLMNYENRRKTSRAQPQPVVQDDTLGPAEREEENTGRVLVSVVSFRRRLCDTDNLCAKWLIDCLRYVGLIRDDSPEYVTIKVSQVKVKTKAEARTEIEII